MFNGIIFIRIRGHAPAISSDHVPFEPRTHATEPEFESITRRNQGKQTASTEHTH